MKIALKSLLPLVLTALIVVFNITDVDAQRRSRRSQRAAETEEEVKPRLTYEIGVGNISLFNRQFAFSVRPAAGFKISDHFTLGLMTKYYYNLYTFIGTSNVSTHTYGTGPYAQLKFLDNFYAKVVADYSRYQYATTSANTVSFTEFSPFFGGGYKSGFGDWSYGIEILFTPNDRVQTFFSPVEYWAIFHYNF